jgi:hypothetical protein
MEFIDKILSQYGFGVATSIIMFFFFYKVLNYVMLQSDKLIEQSNERDKEFYAIMEGYKTAIETQTSQSMEHQKEIKTGFEFNRKEHEQHNREHSEMIQVLGRINGFKQ